MNIPTLSAKHAPVAATGKTFELYRNKPVKNDVVRAGDLWLDSFNDFNLALDKGNNLTGSVWVATPDKENGECPKSWHRVFNGTIPSSAYLEAEANDSVISLYGFPVGFNGLERDVIDVSPDSLLIFDLKAEEPKESLARKLCAKNSKIPAIEEVIVFDGNPNHMIDAMRRICNSEEAKFKKLCEKRQWDSSRQIKSNSDLDEIRREAPSVNIYEPNIRIFLREGQQDQEVFNLFAQQRHIEDLWLVPKITSEGFALATQFDLTSDGTKVPFYSPLKKGDQFKIVVEYPNAIG